MSLNKQQTIAAGLLSCIYGRDCENCPYKGDTFCKTDLLLDAVEELLGLNKDKDPAAGEGRHE